MNILIAPDKFKGSLTALEVCEILRNEIEKKHGHQVKTLPMADGGEGTLEVIKSNLNTETITMMVKDPLFRTITASYERKGDIAYIEMAAASGLQLIKENQRNPLYTTTYGTGQLIKHAYKNGVKSLYLLVGGSATNDGGMGMLQALGYNFLDQNGEELFGIGEHMNHVFKVVAPTELPELEVKVLCDVQNPFFGENGAAHVYGPQKGANFEDVKLLDEGLKNLSNRFLEYLGKDISKIPGSGAAGGIAGGAVAGLNASLVSGIETLMQIVDFHHILNGVDLVITGEGKLDHQTLEGKLIKGIARAASAQGIPCIGVCGMTTLNSSQIASIPLDSVYALIKDEMSTEYAIENAKMLLHDLAKEIKEIHP